MDDLYAKFPSITKKTTITSRKASLEEQEKTATNRQSNLDFSNQSNFIKSFETILKDFEENELKQINSPEKALNRFQDELRAKWNDFATMLGNSEVYQLPTAEHSVFDIRL